MVEIVCLFLCVTKIKISNSNFKTTSPCSFKEVENNHFYSIQSKYLNKTKTNDWYKSYHQPHIRAKHFAQKHELESKGIVGKFKES